MSLLRTKASLLVAVFLILALVVAVPAGAQGTTPDRNDIELALVIDGSGSIGAENFVIMTQGIAEALENPACVPQDGSVWVSVSQFANGAVVHIPMTEINAASAPTIAQDVRDIPYASAGGKQETNYDAGINAGLSTYAHTGRRQVMNFATDGNPTVGEVKDPVVLRQRVIDAGVEELDAEGIVPLTGSLDISLLQDLVHPQPGDIWEDTPLPPAAGWVRQADTFDEFADSICAKLLSVASGRLIVRKVTNPPGAGHIFDFTLTGEGTNEAFQLKDGEQFSTEANLAAGNYIITEIDFDDGGGGEAGWTTTIECDTVPPTTVGPIASGDRVVTVPVEFGPVTCTYTNSADPTSVQLAALNGAVKPDHVLLTWETVSEVSNLGFKVYRSDSADGARSLLTPAMIPTSNPGAAQGSAYSYQDFAVQAGATYYYWVEDLDSAGKTALHGPAAVTFVGPTSVGLNSFNAVAGSAPALLAMAGAGLATLAGLAVARRKQD